MGAPLLRRNICLPCGAAAAVVGDGLAGGGEGVGWSYSGSANCGDAVSCCGCRHGASGPVLEWALRSLSTGAGPSLATAAAFRPVEVCCAPVLF